jgi:GAF domain
VRFGDAMPATITILQREIIREERRAGIALDQPLTDAAIVRRRVQIAVLLALLGLVCLAAMLAATGALRLVASILALGFGYYALEKERHLQRLACLRDDANLISLAVADELVVSGVLATDRELLDLRIAIELAAPHLAAGLAEVLPTDCARVRVTGPSGEVPIAAERDLAPGRFPPDDAAIARAAVQHRHSVRRSSSHGRAVLTVPLWRRDEVVGVLELVSHPGQTYLSRDAGLVDAYGRGVVAALLALG